ncbi:hypothetical protein WR25_26813 [Diploscapter pachys]|uniref:C2H2-type domain-containing protein n=1 Tax=Diploscapter pachys TaxID=2018661 RepID=A0A2A2KKR3_9BILA|nr:hypothetical protein WR25_26813 [Diploscapter pachys]
MTELTPMVIIDIPEGAENEQPRRNRFRRNEITVYPRKIAINSRIRRQLNNKHFKEQQEAQKALEQQEAQRQEDESECTDDEEDEEETADEDDNCDNTCDEYDEEDEDEQEEEDGDDDLIEIDDGENFDELKEKLKKINAGVVVNFYDREADLKNDNAARGLLIMPIPNFCSHRKDDTFEGTIERIDRERRNAQLKNAFSKSQAITETVTYKVRGVTKVVKQLVLHPVYDKSNPQMMKYSYGTLTYNAVLDFYRSKPKSRVENWKIRTDFEKLMEETSCPRCDDIGHVIGYLLGGSYDARNLFLQNSAVNFNMAGFEKRQFNFLTHNEGRSIDYIVEYINGDNVNGVVRYKEIVWHIRYHAENGLVGELHFTMPNPRGVKETYFKKKKEAIDSEKYAEPEPKLEFETYYGELPNYIMKYNVDWNELRSNVLDDCNKNRYGIPKFEKKINRNSDGHITLHPIFSNGGKRLEYLYGQFEVKKTFDQDQTRKWKGAHNWMNVGPMKLAEKNALPGDQYGHVLSACLGGSFEDVNMYPQNEEINLDMGSDFEYGICNKIKKDMEMDKVTVEAMFNFTYASSGVGNVKHPRPESTNVCLRIKNGKQSKWRAICFDLPNPESVLRPYYEEFARLSQDNLFVSTIPMTKGGQDKTLAQYGFTVPRKGVDNPKDNNIVCPVCKRETFGKYYHLLRHLRIHDKYSPKDFVCEIPECTYRTDREDQLQSHMKHKHDNPDPDDIKRRECSVTRKDRKKCTFYAYTVKEITEHRDKHAFNVDNFKLDCPVSTACPFMADTVSGFKAHIKKHKKEQSCKGDPSQAQPSLTEAQPDKEEMFKCPITDCDKTWPIKENMDPSCFLLKINRHLENQHRKKEPSQKFQQSELDQLAEEKGIKDSKGESVKLMPCKKGCLKIFMGDEGLKKHDEGTKDKEYYEAHRKDREDPNNPEWTDEEKQILKKYKFKPSSGDKKGFLQVEVSKP